jgi:pimeloyl-ACP methyl ester carboxylesterase
VSEPRFFEIADGRVEYVWFGPPPSDAPAIVCLHDGLGCAALWRDFPARLAEATGCGVVAYSRFGYGASSPCDLPRPLTFMHAEGLRVLPGVLEALDVRECVLLGHSDGGSIALVYAGGTPAPQVRGLVLEAAHVFCEELSVRSIAAAREEFERGDLRARLARWHGANVDCAFHGWAGAWLDPGFRRWDLQEYLPGVRVPVLCIQGEDDEYGTRAQVDAIAAKAGGPVETSMLPGCGHTPHRDRAEEVLAAASAFVQRVLGRP